MERLSDMSWSVLSYGINLAYHFWVIQVIALVCIISCSYTRVFYFDLPFQIRQKELPLKRTIIVTEIN